MSWTLEPLKHPSEPHKMGPLVPQLWHLEVRPALITAKRRGRINAKGLDERIGALGELPARTDTSPDLEVALDLAREHELSFYDAVYLELALRSQSSLAMLDTGLSNAAAARGVELV